MSKISRETLLAIAREAMEYSVAAMRTNAIAEATTPPSKLKSAAQQFDKTECFLEHFAELVLAAREHQQAKPVAQSPSVKDSLTAQVAIPASYALVPIEPTEEMIDDSRTALLMDGMDAATWLLQNTYRVMLANAPQPPAVVSADELVAAEREACAKVAEGKFGKVNATPGSRSHIAAAIRARGAA